MDKAVILKLFLQEAQVIKSLLIKIRTNKKCKCDLLEQIIFYRSAEEVKKDDCEDLDEQELNSHNASNINHTILFKHNSLQS